MRKNLITENQKDCLLDIPSKVSGKRKICKIFNFNPTFHSTAFAHYHSECLDTLFFVNRKSFIHPNFFPCLTTISPPACQCSCCMMFIAYQAKSTTRYINYVKFSFCTLISSVQLSVFPFFQLAEFCKAKGSTFVGSLYVFTKD